MSHPIATTLTPDLIHFLRTFRNSPPRVHIFYGIGDNGKTTFVNILRTMFKVISINRWNQAVEALVAQEKPDLLVCSEVRPSDLFSLVNNVKNCGHHVIVEAATISFALMKESVVTTYRFSKQFGRGTNDHPKLDPDQVVNEAGAAFLWELINKKDAVDTA